MESGLTWSERAVINLKAIREYISVDSPMQAMRVVSEIIGHTEILKDFPETGGFVPEMPDSGLRQIFKHSYRIVYASGGGAVCIIAVVHSRQDFVARLLGK